MRAAALFAILTAAVNACVGPATRQASTEAETASFLAADPRAAEMVRLVQPLPRPIDEECRRQGDCTIVPPSPSSPGAEYRHWVVLAPAPEGQRYSIPQFILRTRFPLRFATWVQSSHFPDDENEHGFSLDYWNVDCLAGTYGVQTELKFSAEGRVTSARRGAGHPLRPAAGSGEALLLAELCDGRTDHPPPGYRPYD